MIEPQIGEIAGYRTAIGAKNAALRQHPAGIR
jgi:hypothetical protein